MLTLGRKSGEYIVMDDKIVIQVVEVGNQLRLAIDAPKDVRIERGEKYEETHPVPDCIQRVRSKGTKPRPFDFSRTVSARAGDGLK